MCLVETQQETRSIILSQEIQLGFILAFLVFFFIKTLLLQHFKLFTEEKESDEKTRVSFIYYFSMIKF